MARHAKGREAQRGEGAAESSVAPTRRWPRLVFLVVTLWLVGAVLVVFFGGLSSAERSGALEQRAARYQQYLRSGWYPLEVDPLVSGTTQTGWIALNDSRGKVSTIDPDPAWRTMTLRIAPIPCADGAGQSIEITQGATLLRRLAPPVLWASYTVRLTHPGRPVTLRYGCVIGQPAPGRGLQGARQLAILLGGISGGNAPRVPVGG